MPASSAAPRADAPTGRFYPWIFVAAMGLVVLVNAGMIWFAVSTFTGLSTEDPYDKGLAFNRTLAAAETQAALGWQVDVDAAASPAGAAPTVTLAVAFRDRAGRMLDGLQVRAFLVRPTSAGHDRAVDLAAAGEGRYRATAALALRGEWLLTIVASKDKETWQSTRRIHLR
jgi:nitrogen fixation protein FixH